MLSKKLGQKNIRGLSGLQQFSALRIWASCTSTGRGACVVAIAVSIFLLHMVPVLRTHHYNFGTQNFDIGIFDQATYQLSNFEQFMTTRGLNVFGHHVNIGLFLFVPLYWIGLGGVNTLNIASAVSLAGAAFPIYAIGVRQTKSASIAAVIAVVYLMNFSVSALVNEGFHPEKMAVPALFFAVLGAQEKRWRLYVASLVYALIWKEDISLFVLMLGVYVALTQSRKIGVWTSVVGASYFFFATRFLLPHFNDADSTFYGSQYGELGNETTEIAANALLFKRDTAYTMLQQNDAASYFFDIGQPFGMLAYFSPHWLLLSLPHFAVNLLNIHGLAANPLAHYVAIPVVASTLAVIATMKRFKVKWLRVAFCFWMLLAGSTTMVSRGFTPLSENYESGAWQIYDNERSADLRGSLALIPDDAVVMATYDLIPHMSHRRDIYMYPNPYEIEYWGIGDAETANPETIEYIALNRAAVDPERPLVEQIEASESFEVVYESGDVIVVTRIAPSL